MPALRLLIVCMLLVGGFTAAARASTPEPGSADFYLRLGLSPTATFEDIQLEGSKLISQYAHMVAKGARPQMLLNVMEAVEILLPPEKRQAYDRTSLPADRVPKSYSAPLPGYETEIARMQSEVQKAVTAHQTFANSMGDIELAPDETPQRPTPSVVASPRSSSEDSLSALAKKLSRGDIIIWTKDYDIFRNRVRDQLFSKEMKYGKGASQQATIVTAVPKEATAYLRAQLNREGARTWPGTALGLSILIADQLWLDSSVALGAGLLFLGSDAALKLWASYWALPQARSDMRKFVRDNQVFRRMVERDKSVKSYRTRLSAGLLFFDTWLAVHETLTNAPQSAYGQEENSPLQKYKKTYAETHSFTDWLLEEALKDSGFAQGMLLRVIQNKISSPESANGAASFEKQQFYEGMRRNPEYWYGIAVELRAAIQSQKDESTKEAVKQISDELTVEVQKIMTQLAPLNKGSAGQFVRWGTQSAKHCLQSLVLAAQIVVRR